MRTNIKLFFTAIFLAGSIFAWAQQKTISGQITDSDGFPVADAYVYVEGTDNGVYTDGDGNYSLSVNEGDTVAVEFIGFDAKTISVGGADTYNVSISRGGVVDLGATVATAFGIERDKKSLGYATQEIGGDDVADVAGSNFADALSGEVAGLNTQSFGGMGGSANIVVRGYSSLTQSNQALIVIDGTPVINSTGNSGGMRTGRGGYDYGNAATDLNPNDIESINVLKGSAATALYGSRAANGALIITTKKGDKNKGLGITYTSTYTAGWADKETLPRYQNKYGAGYGRFYQSEDGYFNVEDFDGDGVDDEVVPFTEDASYGAAFDPNRQVVQWFNIYPQLPGYQGKAPWLAGASTPNDFLETSSTFQNTIAFGNGNEDGNYRLSYTNYTHEGILPNSKLDRNNISFNGGYNFTDKLNVSSSINYIRNKATGRYGTGYDSGNPFQAFRQWWQTNVDIDQQRLAYETTGDNITWNTNSSSDLSPIYSDNPYWNRYHNYQNDSRNRILGNVALNYEFTDWFNVVGKVSLDTYDEKREERIDVGAADVANYTIREFTNSEFNYDVIGNFNKDLTESINFDGNLGWNLRVESFDSNAASTNGGLIVPGLFTLANSANPLTPNDVAQGLGTKKVFGYYGRASFGFYDKYFLEGTYRVDKSSTLPENDRTYGYYSLSGSWLFSEEFKQSWLSYGKLRANYAKVGNDAPIFSLYNTYNIAASFAGSPSADNPATFNNPNLKPEISKELEFGLEMRMFKNRVGFDVSYYNRLTEDLITPIEVSASTGARRVFLNGGDVRNKGIELFFDVTPIKSENFAWTVKFNWAKNTNEVEKLANDIEFLPLGTAQGGITVGAFEGSPFGVILGRDYVYHENGQRIVYTEDDAPSGTWVGAYARTSDSNNIIGDINPDWIGGIKNEFRYKGLSASFLIDIQKGGDVFSLDTWYGYATGLYDFTAGTNELGNPVRNSVADGGGVILPGVNADGTPNETRGRADWYANVWGYVRSPQAAHIYDASFVKLREAKLSYLIPTKLYTKTGIKGLTLSIIGRNLWIIDKNVPFADPEAGLSAGNIQGFHSGAYPSVREIGGSVKIEF